MTGTRATALLAVLVAVLLIVLWYFLLWSPAAEDLEAVETEITTVQAQQDTTRARVSVLRGVRDEAPQLQSELAASESLLPRDTALPSVLRQFQAAADESGATLTSVSPSRPAPVEGSEDDLYSISLNAEIRGGYFQIVDMLRRLEDPDISPRGIVWDSIGLVVDEYPTLTATLNGRIFAVLPQPPGPETTPPEAPPTDDDEADPDGDAPEDDAPEDDGAVDPPTQAPPADDGTGGEGTL